MPRPDPELLRGASDQLLRAFQDFVRAVVRAEVADAIDARDRPDEYLSVAVAARLASVAPATIRRWVKAGRLERYGAGRVLRVRRANLEERLRNGFAPEESPEVLAERAFGPGGTYWKRQQRRTKGAKPK